MRDKLRLEFIWPSSSSSSSSTTSTTAQNWKAYESTDRRTCIDWCMSRACPSANQQSSSSSRQAANSSNNNSTIAQPISTTTSRLTVYESWFSDHKPLWLEININ